LSRLSKPKSHCVLSWPTFSPAISTKFLNIIIRTNHGQTEIVMQYGGLRSSITCVTTSCSNDSFASNMQTHKYFATWNHLITVVNSSSV
jgi:hypothetical protein